MYTSGIVFDIQRFSLNDGPGIRTTVFLKGCPLKCLWCHNPESQSFKPQLSFNVKKCTDCFECVKVCPSGVHKNVNGKHTIDFDVCKLSTGCIKACPFDALSLFGYQSSVEEIILEVLKDERYYKNSNGGITISGGEPLAQFEFTKALLIAAKEAGLHTCVDTCGFAKQKLFEEILPYTDLFLFDYKTTDPLVHKKLTGTDNRLVLDNLNFLYEKNASIILRCPLIPGINDFREDLEKIAVMGNKYPMLKEINLLPYHPFGEDKLKRIGEKSSLLNVQLPTEEQKKGWFFAIKEKLNSDKTLLKY